MSMQMNSDRARFPRPEWKVTISRYPYRSRFLMASFTALAPRFVALRMVLTLMQAWPSIPQNNLMAQKTSMSQTCSLKSMKTMALTLPNPSKKMPFASNFSLRSSISIFAAPGCLRASSSGVSQSNRTGNPFS